MNKKALPLGIAALALAGVAVPTAAQAATTGNGGVSKPVIDFATTQNNGAWDEGELDGSDIWVNEAQSVGIGGHGKTTVGEKVVVKSGGKTLCTTTDPGSFVTSRSWECVVNTHLAPGEYKLRAISTRISDGVKSAKSKLVTLHVNGTPGQPSPTPVDPAVPNPGETDPGFTGGSESAVPNPGETDPGFTAPGKQVAAPSILSQDVNSAGGYALVVLHGEVGATATLTNPSINTSVSKTFNESGRAILKIDVKRGTFPTLTAHQTVGGLDSAAIDINF